MAALPNDDTNPLFLYYLLTSMKLSAWAEGSALPYLKQSTLSGIEVLIPEDNNDQIRISKILANFDQLIDLNLRTNDYLTELIRAEFAHRFGAETPTTDLGKVMSISTRSLKPSEYSGEIWEHFSIPAFDERHRPVFEPADEIKSNKYAIDNNCILISKLNPSTKRLWLPSCTSDRSVCSTEFIVYKAKRPEHKSFYYAAIDSPAFTDYLLAHVTGSTGSRQRAQPKTTLSYPIPNPSDESIDDFCRFADPIIEKCQLNEQESALLEDLRDTLLPKLMDGELDVSGIELPMQPNNHLSEPS